MDRDADACLARIREISLALPRAAEKISHGTFGPSGWLGIRLHGASVDWIHVGDRIARSWELVAPRRLLEMGGR